MTPAYVIASYDVTSAAEYQAYLAGLGATLQKHKAEILVAGTDAQNLEGEAKDVYVVLRFASAAKAQAYQEIGLAVAQAWGEAARNPELLAIVARASSPDSSVAASLSEVEYSQSIAMQIHNLRLWEIVYLNVEVGALGPEAMDQMGNWRKICEDPQMGRDWDAIKPFLGDAFGQFVASECVLPW